MYALLKNINSVPEKEVSKGIYITDYRKQATLMPPQDLYASYFFFTYTTLVSLTSHICTTFSHSFRKLNGSLEMQAIEITTLETSIRYLIRSVTRSINTLTHFLHRI
jgi:hypothetical protein